MPYKVRTTVTRKNKKSPYVKKTIVKTTHFRISKPSRRPKMSLFDGDLGMLYEKTFKTHRDVKKHLKKTGFKVSGFIDRDKDGYVYSNDSYIW